MSNEKLILQEETDTNVALDAFNEATLRMESAWYLANYLHCTESEDDSDDNPTANREVVANVAFAISTLIGDADSLLRQANEAERRKHAKVKQVG